MFSPSTVVIVPNCGDSPESLQPYVDALNLYYDEPRVEIFMHNYRGEESASAFPLMASYFFEKKELSNVEIHAQGGVGAYVTCLLATLMPGRIRRIFFIGGAPSDALTTAGMLFHRNLSQAWLVSSIPFQADDPPNPLCDDIIKRIRIESTKFMQLNPNLYAAQLLLISNWKLPKGWKIPAGISAYFVPNGDSLRSEIRDNPYDRKKAARIWRRHGVMSTSIPENNFSYHSLMPARALFKVMDEVCRDVF